MRFNEKIRGIISKKEKIQKRISKGENENR